MKMAGAEQFFFPFVNDSIIYFRQRFFIELFCVFLSEFLIQIIYLLFNSTKLNYLQMNVRFFSGSLSTLCLSYVCVCLVQ